MHRWTDLREIPPGFGPSVVTLGNFDGVHRGHRIVLTTVVEQARARGASAVAVTFTPHPLAVIAPERAPELITAPDHRLDLLEATGIDALLTMTFTRELAAWTPEEFVERVFVGALHASAVVVGRDARFGVRNTGDVDTLRRLGVVHGMDVVVVEDQGNGGRWSSSRVREHLVAGEVAEAAEVLGRPHRVSGEVVHGDHRGRALGYPTANLSQDCTGLVPADGIYAGWLVRHELPLDDPERTLPAAVSIGSNPTFDGTQRRVEAYVLDRTDLELYGEQVSMELVRRLRPTIRFDSVDELLVQMAQDVEAARAVLTSIVPA